MNYQLLGKSGLRVSELCLGTIPILGARKLEQFRDNLNCLKWSLNAKQLAQLDEVSRIEPVFRGTFWIAPSCAIIRMAACSTASSISTVQTVCDVRS